MNLSIFELLHVLSREVWEKRRIFALLYVTTSISFLVAGWFWPKIYSSESTILVDERNILRPLMEGTAVTTDVVDRARRASEIVFSRAIMDKTLEKFGWNESNPDELEKERIVSQIQERTQISSLGGNSNLIRISYSDRDPVKAYEVTEFFAEQFIAASIAAKQKESRSAYDFINEQVNEYHEKLKTAEEALKDYRSQNLDANPGTQGTVDARIIELRRKIESTELELRELSIREDTLDKQISGEADVTATLSREGQFAQRLANLQAQLEELRLTYHDTYPDIVRIKSQMAEVEKLMAEDRAKRAKGDNTGNVGFLAADNTLYQDLRSKLSSTKTEIATLNARLTETQDLLHKEEARIIRINEVDAKLAELTRDYEVNQSLYNSLLRQRESAYISMNIDAQNQGVTFKVQEPAALQLTPKGIRFAHFWAGGLVMSFVVPLGLIYGITLVDQKVRDANELSEKMGLPVLASVYHINTPTEYNLNTAKKSIITLVILMSWIAYGYAAWLKFHGNI